MNTDAAPFHLLVAILPAIAACLLGSFTLYAWQRRDINGAQSFALCSASIFIWCFFAVFEQLSPTRSQQIIFGKLEYFGIAPFPSFWIVFTLQYAQYDGWLNKRVFQALSVIPILTLTFALSDRYHGLIWKATKFYSEPFPRLEITHGWWFNHVATPYCYAMLITGLSVLLTTSFAGSRWHRRQTFVLVTSALFTFMLNVVYIMTGHNLYGLDPTPIGFTVLSLAIRLSLFHTKFLDIAPVSYKTVFLNTADAVVLLDRRSRIVDLNPSALAEGRKQIDKRAAFGKPFGRVFPDYGTLLEKLAEGTGELTEVVKLSRLPLNSRSGQVRDIFRNVKVRSLLSPGGRHMGWVIIIRDVTLEKQQQAQLEQFAFIDSLTGLYNRRQLELKAEEIFVSHSERPASRAETSVALLYVDLNRFKPINDTYGHDVGDAVLQTFAQCLRNSVRQDDTVARIGGDEFVALVHEANTGVALEVRSRLMKLLARPVVLSGHSFTLSASVGIAYYPKDGVTLQDLLRQADANMYQEKRLSKKSYSA